MNKYENDIKYFLNTYSNSFKENNSEEVAKKELKKALKMKYLDKAYKNGELTLLFTHFYGTAALISPDMFARDIALWYHHNGTTFTGAEIFNRDEEGKNPLEKVPYANELPVRKTMGEKITQNTRVQTVKKERVKKEFDLDDIQDVLLGIF